jgi:hypothetical protein
LEHGPYQSDVYTDHLPQGLHLATWDFVRSLMDTLTAHEGVALQVVVYGPRRWDFRPSSVELHSAAHFKTRYRFVEKMARLLASTYVEQLILPVILPYTPRQWNEMVQFAPAVYEGLHSRGIRSFASRELL